MSDITGIPGPLLTPGSDEWLATISASKISAIVGLNPWQSAFSLWHEMKGNVPRPAAGDVQKRGHYLEPAICAWFVDQHDTWTTDRIATTWRHPEHQWATASPDARITCSDIPEIRFLEAKSSGTTDDWTPTDIPPGYRAQVMWQLFVTGARTAHVAVLLPYLEFREYVIEYDEAYAEHLFAAAVDFRLSLANGEQPPLDGAASTYITLRNLHPDIADETAEIDYLVASDWLRHREALALVAEAEQQARSVLVEQMGDAHYAECNGWRLGDRRAKGEGVPYFQPARNLPTPEQVTEPRPAKDAA